MLFQSLDPSITLRQHSPVVLALALTIAFFTLNLSFSGPAILPDSGAYLAQAAAFAGFPNDLASCRRYPATDPRC